MNSVFNEQILADKLSKLNSTQQCIETLSHWCIFHRQKAKQVVQTWEKQFQSSQKEQKIPFLYLANDILQNSRRKGDEFVVEFWKVLPAALKDVAENGEERGKNVVSRLVGIWEERKVFGSRAQTLEKLMLGNEPPPDLEFNKKRSRSVKIIKRDPRSVKIKLSVGGTTEKIVSAFHAVISEHHSEDAELSKCKASVHRVGKMEKDVDLACSQEEDPRRATLTDELLGEEKILQQCIEGLRSVETNRTALVSQLREALQEQESALENVRTQIQVAQAQIEEATNMRRRLNNESIIPPTTLAATPKPNSNSSATGTPRKSAAAIAAEVADRLAASTHSQQIMTSVLSTFAAQEAKNAGLGTTTTSASTTFSETPPEKQLKLDKPVAAVVVHQPTMSGQAPPVPQPQYSLFPAPSQQYMQSAGGMIIGVPYTYSSLPTQPAPTQMMNMVRPAPMALQQPMTMIQPQPPPPPLPPPPMTLQQTLSLNQQPAQLPLQQPAPPGYRPLQPPGMAFYHQSQ